MIRFTDNTEIRQTNQTALKGAFIVKKTVCILIAVIMIWASFSLTAFAADEIKPVSVSYEAGGSEKVSEAADVLKKYINQLPGNEVVKESDSVCSIVITGGEASDMNPDGSYSITGTSDKIEITGYGHTGIMYAVYDFLREYGGYHDYSADMGMKTENEELVFPEAINIEYSPAFEYTDTDWPAPSNAEFAAANGMNGRLLRSYVDELGGSSGYISNFCHTLTTQFCSSDKYFNEDPELFALHDGRRTPGQLCLTNEKTFQIVLGEVMELLKERHDPEASLQIISLTQHDNTDYCECSECSKIDEENGSHAGSILTFVNRIAKAVKGAAYDNVAIDTFAYQYSRNAPSKIAPEDNVIIRLCTIEGCFAHTLDDASCTQNAAIKADLEAWNKICDNIYIWDYTIDYGCYCGIFPDFGVLQKNMQFFKEHGVRGVFEEGDAQSDEQQPGFGELRAYLISRLLRNPYCDYEAEFDGFVNAYYGKGGQKIKEFIKKMDENAAKSHAMIFDEMSKIYSLTDEEAAELDKLWDEAKALCKDDITSLEHIEESEISWRYVKSALKLGEFKNIGSRYSANSLLYKELKAHNSVFSTNGDDVPIEHFFKLFPADEWTDGNKQSVLMYFPSIIMYAAVLIFCLLIFILALKNKKYSYLVHLPLLTAFVEALMWSRRAFLAWKAVDEYIITLCIFFAVMGFVFVQKNRLVCSSNLKAIGRSLLDLSVFFVLYAVPLLTIKKQFVRGDTNSDYALALSYTLCAVFVLCAVIITSRKLKKA